MGGSGFLGMRFTPWVTRLMIATGVLSIVGAVAAAWLRSTVPLWFVLQPAAVWGQGQFLPGIPALWQLLTYPLFVFDPLGLLFTLAAYGWFAGSLEEWWGSKRFLKFVLIVTAGSAAATVALATVWPALRGATYAGGWPLVEAMVIAWGLTFPNRQLLLMFVLPVSGRALVWITVGLTGLYVLFSGTFVPFVPAIVGMAIGAMIVTGTWRPRRLWLHLKKAWLSLRLRAEEARRRRRANKARLRVVKGGGQGSGKKGNGAPGGGWIH